MQLSLRSQMIAGIAALGATAVAITPIAQSAVVPSLARVSSAVQLSAFVNPIAAVAGVIEGTVADTFNSAALPDQNSLYWPDSFYSDTNYDILYAPGYVGLIPDTVNQFSFGSLSALVNNISGYAEAGLSATALVEGVTTFMPLSFRAFLYQASFSSLTFQPRVSASAATLFKAAWVAGSSAS